MCCERCWMRRRSRALAIALTSLALALAVRAAWGAEAPKEEPPPEPQEAVFVDQGKAELVEEIGRKWTQGDGFLECSGTDNFLRATRAVGSGDFRITVEMTLVGLERSAASLVIGDDSHFGFAGGNNKMFVEGPFFRGGAQSLGPAEGTVPEGKPFVFEMARKGQEIVFSIDGKKVHSMPSDGGPLGRIALRPWRSTMRVSRFVAFGRMLDLPRAPRPKPDDAPAAPALEDSHQTDAFLAGQDGYHAYRIPSVVVTPKGAVLAFCEGRRKGMGDSGDIDLVLKRSEDGGRTFSGQQVVWDDAENTCGNPCPVIDRQSGTIWLLLTRNLGADSERAIVARKSQGARTVWVSRSDDDGRTWTKPVDITKDTKKPEWTWYATGPGAGIQIAGKGGGAGRLVVPCDHIADGGEWASHVIYSDDAGKTWKLGGSAPPKTNECEVVELADGRLMLNMRNYNRLHRCRAVATSADGGLTWSEVAYDEALVEPVCQASIRRLSPAGKGDVLLFSNPASADQRKAMTVRLSEDGGKTWPASRLLWAGPAAYSCLAVMADGTILCLYERGQKHAYEKITLARFDVEWLRGGKE